MEPGVFLAYISLFLGQFMFTFATSICEMLPLAGCWGAMLHTPLQLYSTSSHRLPCYEHLFCLLDVASSTFFQSTALNFTGKKPQRILTIECENKENSLDHVCVSIIVIQRPC